MADGQDGVVTTDQRAAVSRIRIDADPESVEKGLVTLVLTLVELLRQLMERQALRRMEQGSLKDDQTEKVGSTLMALEARMAELRDHFGLTVEDLNLDLGPLGPLLPLAIEPAEHVRAGADGVALGCAPTPRLRRRHRQRPNRSRCRAWWRCRSLRPRKRPA